MRSGVCVRFYEGSGVPTPPEGWREFYLRVCREHGLSTRPSKIVAVDRRRVR